MNEKVKNKKNDLTNTIIFVITAVVVVAIILIAVI